MNNYKKILISAFSISAFFVGLSALAATPTLFFGTSTDGNTVPVTVNGDANSSVLFFYTATTGSGLHLAPIGMTNASGNLATTVSASQYSIAPSTVAYVTVNGQQSAQLSWPILNSSAVGTLSLSQSSLTLSPGQQSYVTVTNSLAGGSIFISTNSNPSVASATISGSQVIITANSGTASGSSVITVCAQTNAANCASVYVSVQGNYSGTTGSQTISFNQNNVSLPYGQTMTVLVSGNGGYSVTNTFNTSVVRASITGNAVILTGYSSGTANLNICESDGKCAILYVTVTSPYNQITFDQSTVTLSAGQSQTVQPQGGTGYYISSNSNASAASASITGASVLIFANNPGTTSITVCGTGTAASQCGVISVTVTGAASSSANSSNAPVTFSQTNLSLSAGQSQTVTAIGSGNYAISSNSNASVVSATLSGSAITVQGINPGTASITVCQNGILCGTFFVTVTGNVSGSTSGLSFANNSVSLSAGTNQLVAIYGSGSFVISSNTNPSIASAAISGTNVIVSAINPGTTNVTVCIQNTTTCAAFTVTVGGTSIQALTFSPSSLTLAPGQGQPVQVYGSGNYFISNDTNSSVATAAISGNGFIVNALNLGTANITVCQNGTQCGTLPVMVENPQPVISTPVVSTPAYVPPVSDVITSNTYRFTLALRSGSKGAEVHELQKKLKALGYYSYAITGTYGPITVKAVKAFQKAEKLSQLGSVSPGTRAALNR